MNPYDTLSSLKQVIQNKGRTIANYRPAFTNDELHEYYQDLKNGMWEDFCNKIHIPGDIDEKMKRDLLNAEKNTANAWAFKEGHYKQPDFGKGYLLREYGHLL